MLQYFRVSSTFLFLEESCRGPDPTDFNDPTLLLHLFFSILIGRSCKWHDKSKLNHICTMESFCMLILNVNERAKRGPINSNGARRPLYELSRELEYALEDGETVYFLFPVCPLPCIW